MSWDNNIHSNPEKFGLTMVGEIDFSDGCYQFDLTAVWRRDVDGALVWADDSGCSCPSPFEDKGIPDLQTGSVTDLQAHLEARNLAAYDDGEAERARRQGEIVDLIARCLVNA